MLKWDSSNPDFLRLVQFAPSSDPWISYWHDGYDELEGDNLVFVGHLFVGPDMHGHIEYIHAPYNWTVG